MTPARGTCWICLDELPTPGDRYHPACLSALFGIPRAPRIDFDELAIASWADEHAGRLSISGVQPKGPAALTEDGAALVLVERDSAYIVKPSHPTYLHMPLNEHLTMRLARLVGLEVAEHGLIELSDGAIAYITRRFDRPSGPKGPRLHVVDFCQVAGLPAADKELANAELCAELSRKSADAESVFALFRLLVFAYWVRNGDLHLKNLMLRETPEGSWTLAPAYDLLCTEFYNVRGVVLPVGGEKVNIARRKWLDFAEGACGIERARAAEAIDAILAKLPEAKTLIERSALPHKEWKRKYRHWLDKRSRQLSGRM